MGQGRYGSFQYGAPRKYGTVATSNLLWGLEIDWNNDGVFSEANEASQLVGFEIVRGRTSLFAADVGGEANFARTQIGTLTLTCDNSDRRFDSLYASSPLYPNVQPARDVRFRVRNGNTGTTYDLFRGRIEDIDAQGYRDDPRASIRVSDGWRWLSERKASIALRSSVVSDVMIGDVLDAVSYPSAWGRSLGAGADTLAYSFVENRDAFNVLHEVAESEFGLIFVGADGKFNFISRNTLIAQSISMTLDQSQVGNEPRVSKPWAVVKNIIRVQAHPRTLAALAEIWRLRDTPSVAAGASLTIWAEFQDVNLSPAPATGVVSPVATTDFTMNTASDGSGSDLTASWTVTATIFSGSAKLVITNNSASTGYITLLKVRGQAIAELNTTAYIVEDTDSQTDYGVHELVLNLPFQQSTTFAKNLGDFLSPIFADPAFEIEVEIENRPTIQFAYDLGTYIGFTSAYLGISHSYRIGKIVHLSRNSMQDIVTRWTLLPADESNQSFWLLGTAGRSELGTTTKLGI